MGYRNPDYENVPDDWWSCGYCSIFANALRERFGLPIYAIVEEAVKDGDQTLVHAVGLKGGLAYDAGGARPIAEVMNAYEPGIYYPNEESRIRLLKMSLRRLDEIHDVDLRATYEAHRYIERHPQLFKSLVPRA